MASIERDAPPRLSLRAGLDLRGTPGPAVSTRQLHRDRGCNATTRIVRFGKAIRHGHDNSMSCSHQRARRRHRSPVWSVRCAKRRTVPLTISSQGGSCSSARLVDTDGPGTIQGRSAGDEFRSVSVALARERTAMTLLATCCQVRREADED